MNEQQNVEQVFQPEAGLNGASQFSIVLELKPERIQEPTTVKVEEGLGYRLSLSGMATQPLVIELAEPKVTIFLDGQNPPAAA